MEQSQWATIHSLPPEILFYIVRLCITVNFNHFAYGANVASWDSNESIWKMQLVCKAWREPALRASLHSVSIFDLKSARSFLRTLAIDPIRSVCVKYLALGADDSIQGSSHEADSVRIFKESIEMTQVVLAASPALVHLHVHPLHFAARNHLLAAIRSSRHLQTLVISPRFRSWQGEVWGLNSYSRTDVVELSLPPFLQRLELDFASTWSAPVPAIVPEAQPNSIKILWLNCDCEESALWQVLMKSESLEVLQLYFERLLPKEGTVLALMHSTDTMKRLHYTCNPTEEDLVNFDPTETPILDLVLPRYRRLESLSVTATELSCHLFRLLPRSLKTLEITSLNDRAKFFLDLHEILESIQEALRELAEEEIRLSLSLGQHTTLSPAARFQLFGDDLPPRLPPAPDSFDFIFDVKNTMPDSFPKAANFWGEWTSSFLSLYRHLACLLAYATRPTLPSVVRHCWKRLDQASKIYDNCIQRLTQDSRLVSLRTQTRPAGAVTNLVQDELEILQLEWICFRKASQANDEVGLRVIAKRRVFTKLSLECDRLLLLDRTVPHLYRIQSAGIEIVAKLNLFSREILIEWAKAHPDDRDRMISSLQLISYGSPDACRIIDILESNIHRSEWSIP